jgi:hypothetical protein
MTDIFDEVGEDLRRDQMKRIWQRYSGVIIGIAVLIVAATAGWRGYETWAASRAAAAGETYAAAIATAEAGDHKAAAEALLAFASDAPGEYGRLARFRAASEHAAAGDTDNALAAFEALAADGSLPAELRDLARVRAAMLALDKEDLAAVKARVADLDTDINAFRHSAREIVAIAAVKAGAWDEARAVLEKLRADPAVPADVAQRAQILAGVVRAAAGEPEAPAAAGS